VIGEAFQHVVDAGFHEFFAREGAPVDEHTAHEYRQRYVLKLLRSNPFI